MEQFITEELVDTILQDGYPSSHPIQKPITNPYEIEEYFDSIETTKTASILRMIENEFSVYQMFLAINVHELFSSEKKIKLNFFANTQ